MSRRGAVDAPAHFAAVAAAMAEDGQPAATFAALETALDAVLGHKLFTILRYHAASGESDRVWTTQPAAYPVAGRKPLNPTFWSRHVLEQRRPYVGRSADDIRAVFQEGLDFSTVLLDVMTIADEVDSQLKQAMLGFMESLAAKVAN